MLKVTFRTSQFRGLTRGFEMFSNNYLGAGLFLLRSGPASPFLGAID